MKAGDKVIFDPNAVERFKSETSSPEKSVQQYRQLILGGVDQVGKVKEPGLNLTEVTYPDGWTLPVPTKYLIVVEEG